VPGACISYCSNSKYFPNAPYLDRIPILTGEGVHGLLLETLLAL
jgi:hypothetical protein